MNRDTRTFIVGLLLLYAGSILLRSLAATETAFNFSEYTFWHWLFFICGVLQIWKGIAMIAKNIDL